MNLMKYSRIGGAPKYFRIDLVFYWRFYSSIVR